MALAMASCSGGGNKRHCGWTGIFFFGAVTMRVWFSRHFAHLLFIGLLVLWTIILRSYTPTELIENIGVENGYFGAFVLAFAGGMSTFVTLPYHLAIFTFAAGGLNPVLLGLLAGLGVSAGDSTSYLIGYRGREIFPDGFQKKIHRFSDWVLHRPSSWLAPLVFFLYGAMVPFSNDVISISMGLARYPFWRLMIPLGTGNVVFNTAIALLGAYGMSLFI